MCARGVIGKYLSYNCRHGSLTIWLIGDGLNNTSYNLPFFKLKSVSTLHELLSLKRLLFGSVFSQRYFEHFLKLLTKLGMWLNYWDKHFLLEIFHSGREYEIHLNASPFCLKGEICDHKRHGTCVKREKFKSEKKRDEFSLVTPFPTVKGGLPLQKFRWFHKFSSGKELKQHVSFTLSAESPEVLCPIPTSLCRPTEFNSSQLAWKSWVSWTLSTTSKSTVK